MGSRVDEWTKVGLMDNAMDQWMNGQQDGLMDKGLDQWTVE